MRRQIEPFGLNVGFKWGSTSPQSPALMAVCQRTANLRFVEPIGEGRIRTRSACRLQIWSMDLDGDVGQQMAMIHQHEYLCIGEGIHVGANLGDDYCRQRLAIPGRIVGAIPLSGACDTPIRSPLFAATLIGDQVILAERADTIGQNLDVGVEPREEVFRR